MGKNRQSLYLLLRRSVAEVDECLDHRGSAPCDLHEVLIRKSEQSVSFDERVQPDRLS